MSLQLATLGLVRSAVLFIVLMAVDCFRRLDSVTLRCRDRREREAVAR